MPRMPRRLVFASLLLSAACSGSAAYADRPIRDLPSPIALGIAPAQQRAPYDVQVLRDDGDTLPTFRHNGRYYVQGGVDERYVIRVTNPTPRRIEAVVTVDGLDVIDGENGDLRKRGYVVPAYGETRIEGFRTSHADVATFRFSSVGGSYAGQKGKARNVGVIAVAIFEENAPPAPVMVEPAPYDGNYGDGMMFDDDDGDVRPRGAAPAGGRPSARDDRRAEKRAAEPPRAVRAPSPSAPATADAAGTGRYMPPPADEESLPSNMAQRERLGLGTEFGEQRYSAASYTRFERAPGRPIAIAELRYNDTAGLLALGIPVRPLPDAGEMMLRETADPFPGDHFARAPRR